MLGLLGWGPHFIRGFECWDWEGIHYYRHSQATVEGGSSIYGGSWTVTCQTPRFVKASSTQEVCYWHYLYFFYSHSIVVRHWTSHTLNLQYQSILYVCDWYRIVPVSYWYLASHPPSSVSLLSQKCVCWAKNVQVSYLSLTLSSPCVIRYRYHRCYPIFLRREGEPEPELEPKLFQSRNWNRDKSLWFPQQWRAEIL